MRIGDRLASLPPLQVRVHHFTHDRTRADDRHLDHQIVEPLGAQARQAGHLRAALHLEHAYGIRLLKRRINRRIVLRQMREIDLFIVVAADELNRLLERRHHTEPQQVHLDNPHVRAVFLVPLDDHAAGHGGRLERHDRVELPLADHHASGVLAEVARQVLDCETKLQELADTRTGEIAARVAEVALQRVLLVLVFPGADEAGQAVERLRLKA